MRRWMVLSALLVVMSAAMPMPGAIGIQPFRDPFRSGIAEGIRAGGEVETVVFKASKTIGCGFAERVEFTSGGIDWLFSDGREVSVSNARINITNLETGLSFLQTSNYHRTVTTRADGTYLVVIDGSRWMDFSEGEPGPYGTVGPGGHEYFVTGRQTIVVDGRERVLSYSVDGQVLDTCEILT